MNYSGIILGVSSVWNQRKGFFEYIELSQKLKPDEAIVLVGVSEKQKENLPKNIVGITRTANVKELAEIYSAGDLFVNLTLEDNFPTVNLEALACGTHVITYDTGGCKEIVNDKSVSIVEKNNITQVIEKLRAIRNSYNYRFHTNIDYIEKYNKNNMISNYLILYKEKE